MKDNNVIKSVTMAEAVCKRVSELMLERNWSLYRVAKESCVPESTLQNLFNKHTKSPTLTVVFRLADGFGMTYLEFLDSPIFRDENLEIY